MATYSITAIITKIDSANKVSISGVGKHRYEKSKDEVFNLLEETSTPQSSKILKQDEIYSIANPSAIMTTLLAMAMLNKKPLKLTVDDANNALSITNVEVP
ncbi:hypothetical protein [uncultured Fibrobacter sp.]|uniref:hypothetical protein n=1 Tax=uncultured Fibrobacter sp. TaxID=261512 RepID=UPI002622B2D1|nr:hypothetical protein [uncultured Fibrobacter sp.]